MPFVRDIAQLETVSKDIHSWNKAVLGALSSQVSEFDVIEILREWEKTRSQLCEALGDRSSVCRGLKQLEEENSRSRQQILVLQHELTEARAQLSAAEVKNGELSDRMRRLDSMYEIVAQILTNDMLPSSLTEADRRRVLAFRDDYQGGNSNKLAPTSRSPLKNKTGARSSAHSVLSSTDDLSFDPTNEDLEEDDALNVSRLRSGKQWVRPNKKRHRSRSGHANERAIDVPPQPPKKRSKELEDIPSEERRNVRIEPRQSLNRSVSEGQLLDSGKKQQQHFHLRNFASTLALSSRNHTWTSRMIVNPDHCSECLKRGKRKNTIKFGSRAYQCTDCRILLCAECHANPPQPCIPKASTPRKNEKGYLADFVPRTPPMIPHLMVHCLREIERRGLDEVGLYRVPGSDLSVQKLMDQLLWGKTNPDLTKIGDIHQLTGCVKRFLLFLKEPLLPHSHWHELARAVEQPSGDGDGTGARRAAVLDVVASLPQPNRETIAFFLIHLQRVAERSDQNKMPFTNLATVFGPTIIGNSVENPKVDMQLREQGKQTKMMLELLNTEHAVWNSIVNVAGLLPSQDNNAHAPHSASTPSRGGVTKWKEITIDVQQTTLRRQQQRIYPDIQDEATPRAAHTFGGGEDTYTTTPSAFMRKTPGRRFFKDVRQLQ